MCHFLNPRLNGKPRVVHLNCTLMACGDGLSAGEKGPVNQRLLPIKGKNRCVFLFSQSGYEGIDIPRGIGC